MRSAEYQKMKRERSFIIANKLGLHARAAAKVAKLAAQYPGANLRLRRAGDADSCDARSISALLMLAASQDTKMLAAAEGENAAAALAALAELAADKFGEDE
jgi:phosphotransferase system HPr (HPr) family protein